MPVLYSKAWSPPSHVCHRPAAAAPGPVKTWYGPWYVDGIFKLCRRPFNQLLTVNAFVKQGDHAKQVPLLFVIMSGRNKKGYREVFKKLIELLPTAPAVRRMILIHFEKAI